MTLDVPQPMVTVVLAAGQGNRMRSTLPKPLHQIAGKPMIAHILDSAVAAGSAEDKIVAVVPSPETSPLSDWLAARYPEVLRVVQSNAEGTGAALRLGLEAIDPATHPHFAMLNADMPLLDGDTLARMRHVVIEGCLLGFVLFAPPNPEGYGRAIISSTETLPATSGVLPLKAIVEQKDATSEQRLATLCNSGLCCGNSALALQTLRTLQPSAVTNEYYVTELVAALHASGSTEAVAGVGGILPEETDSTIFLGVNTRADLAAAEAAWQQRQRLRWMEAGVTLVDPASVWFSADTVLQSDVTIEPHVIMRGKVCIESGANIRAFTVLDGGESGVHIGVSAEIGPFAHVRPGTKVGERARIGRFVETKNAELAAGAKVPHLAYVGDASVGEGANIGAGVITCNYDGVSKHRTTIGERAFVGSNAALVAPIAVGHDAYVGAGTVISENVAPGALALARAPMIVKEGYTPKSARDKRKAPPSPKATPHE